MPFGIISEAQLEDELNKLNNPPSVEVVKSINHGRGNKVETPMGIRKLIASEALSGASHKELAREFGISTSSVSAYKNGSTSTASYKNKDEELARSNKEVAVKIIGKTQEKLLSAIDALTDEKIALSKARELSTIARDMSTIVKNFTPSNDVMVNNQQVIIYRPRMHNEDEYNVIQVED